MRSYFLRLLLFALIFFSVSPNAKAANWQTPQKEWGRNGTILDHTIAEDLSLQWKKQTLLTKFQQPIYSNGILYYSETKSSGGWAIYAVEKDTGKELWRKTSDTGQIYDTPAISGNILIVPSDDLINLSANTGEEIWRINRTTNYYYIMPVITQNRLLIVKYNILFTTKTLLAIDLVNKNQLWSVNTSYSGLKNLTLDYSNVYLTYSNGSNSIYIRSLRLSDGSQNWIFTRSGRQPGSPLVTTGDGYGVLADNRGYLSKIDLATGQAVYERSGAYSVATVPIVANNKVYFLAISAYMSGTGGDTFLISADYTTGTINPPVKISSTFRVDSRVNPVLVGDKLYFAALNQFWSASLDGQTIKKTDVSPNLDLLYTIFADDLFLTLNYDQNTIYALSDGTAVISADVSIELDSPYKNDGEYNEYLGQTHSHYVPDIKVPGKDITPSYTVSKYKEAGYNFISLTEHNQVIPSPDVSDILFIENSEEDTQGHYGNHILASAINNAIDENGNDGLRIKAISDQLGFSSLAHPNSFYYEWKLNKLLAENNYNGIEVYNTGVDKSGKFFEFLPAAAKGEFNKDRPYASDKWDQLLSSRKHVWATAGDDFTPRNPGFDNAAVIVRSKSLNQQDIIKNLKDGNFYALQGSKAPHISVAITNNTINITSDQKGEISFIGNGGQILQKKADASQGTYTVSGNEIYVRIEVKGEHGRKTWSQPIWVNKIEQKEIANPGLKKIGTSKAIITANTSTNLVLSTVNIHDYPSNSPSFGYASPIYDIATTGTLQQSATLEINYDPKQLPYSEQNLSIFTFDSASKTWQRLTSSIDVNLHTVTAQLTHFSWYVLSANLNDDQTPPTLDLLAPTDLNHISGVTNINIASSDNEQTIYTAVYFDNHQLIFEDWNYADGFSGQVDFSRYVNGDHSLSLVAYDAFGNITQKDYRIFLEKGINSPQLTLLSPTNDDNVCQNIHLIGTYQSNLPIDTLGVFIDKQLADEFLPENNQFNLTYSLEQYNEEKHDISLALLDESGNHAKKDFQITSSCNPTVTPIDTSSSNQPYPLPIQDTNTLTFQTVNTSTAVTTRSNIATTASQKFILGQDNNKSAIPLNIPIIEKLPANTNNGSGGHTANTSDPKENGAILGENTKDTDAHVSRKQFRPIYWLLISLTLLTILPILVIIRKNRKQY